MERGRERERGEGGRGVSVCERETARERMTELRRIIEKEDASET